MNKKELTEPRIRFLKGANSVSGIYAVERYAPAKWALEKKYVEMRRYPSPSRPKFIITPLGLTVLQQLGEV
jgi:hypothetical protein